HGCTLRAPRQQTDTSRNSQLPRPSGRRDGGTRTGARGSRTRQGRLRFLSAVAERARPPDRNSASVWSRPRLSVDQLSDTHRLLPPEPPEYADWQAHASNDVLGVVEGA